MREKTVDNGILFWALGGPSFVYRTPETIIWIDPYSYGTPDDAVPDAYRATAIPIRPDEVRVADILISTHDHVDHCHDGTLVPIVDNTDAFCVAPSSSAKLMREFGIADDRIREVAPGDSIQFRDVEIQVYPSYDPNEPHAVTFVFSSGGTKLFVSGDTWDGPAIAEIGAEHDWIWLCWPLAAHGTWRWRSCWRWRRSSAPRRFCPFTGSSGATTPAISVSSLNFTTGSNRSLTFAYCW